MEEIFFQLPKVIFNLHVHGRDMGQRHKTTVKQVFAEAKNGLIARARTGILI